VWASGLPGIGDKPAFGHSSMLCSETIADLCPALAAAALPWSTTAVSAFWFIWLVVLIPIINYRSLLRSLREPVYWLPLAFFVLALLKRAFGWQIFPAVIVILVSL
jgi:hypothetical protein